MTISNQGQTNLQTNKLTFNNTNLQTNKLTFNNSDPFITFILEGV